MESATTATAMGNPKAFARSRIGGQHLPEGPLSDDKENSPAAEQPKPDKGSGPGPLVNDGGEKIALQGGKIAVLSLLHPAGQRTGVTVHPSPEVLVGVSS